VLASIFLGLLAVWTVFAQPESSTARLLGASNQDANYSVRTLGCPILNIDVIISRPSGNVRTGANAGSVLTFGRRAMIPKTGSPRPSRVSIYPHLC
jgi:hypothetical protein